jgi:hypothetical protein
LPYEENTMETKSAREAKVANVANVPTVTDADVKKKTGRTWQEWFTLLDRDGAAKLDRRRITRIVASKYGVGLWWRRTIAKAYEQSRMARDVGQELASSPVARTSRGMHPPMRALSATMHDVEARARRLKSRSFSDRPAPGTISNRHSAGVGNVDVSGDRFEAVQSESGVIVDSIRDVHPVRKMRAFWKARVDALQKSLAKRPAT